MTEEKNKGHMFQPGVSGNPTGRPKDVFNRPNMLKRSRELGIAPEDLLLFYAARDYKKLGLDEGDITPNMQLKAIIEAFKQIRYGNSRLWARSKHRSVRSWVNLAGDVGF